VGFILRSRLVEVAQANHSRASSLQGIGALVKEMTRAQRRTDKIYGPFARLLATDVLQAAAHRPTSTDGRLTATGLRPAWPIPGDHRPDPARAVNSLGCPAFLQVTPPKTAFTAARSAARDAPNSASPSVASQLGAERPQVRFVPRFTMSATTA